jgi:acetyl-CoA carboxylase biotin carboxyl carrier protein
MNLTNEDVQEILELLDATSYNELQVQTAQFRLSVRRSGTGSWIQSAQVLSPANLVNPLATSVADPAETGKASAAAVADGLVEVRAPLVGSFYRSAKPGAAPFVEVGSKVEPTTLIGIIETMKLMNSVYAGVTGEVVEICVGNGQAAEQGAPLMRIRPEGA